MNRKIQERADFTEWDKLGYLDKIEMELPQNMTQYAQKYNLTMPTLVRWRKENRLREKDPDRDNAEGLFSDEDFDVQGWLKKNRQKVTVKFIQDCLDKGNSKHYELAFRLMGELIDKHEVKIGLTADEIARRNAEADRRLGDFGRGSGHRVESVQEESPLLPDEIRQDK